MFPPNFCVCLLFPVFNSSNLANNLDNLNLEICNLETSKYVGLTEVKLSQIPVNISSGGHVGVAVLFDLIQMIEKGAKLSVVVTKIGAINLEIPCIDVN